MSDARFIAMFELALTGLIALIAGVMAGLSIHAKDASGAAAWSALLMAIVSMIKEGRSSRTIDRMSGQLATSQPPQPDAPTGKPGDPISVTEENQ